MKVILSRKSTQYGGSVELWRAMKAEADVLIALEVCPPCKRLLPLLIRYR